MYKLKNIILKVTIIIFFFYELNGMYRAYQLAPKRKQLMFQEQETKKRVFENISKQKRIEEQALLLKPNEFLIYDEKTGYGVRVDADFVDYIPLSNKILPGTHTIPVPYSQKTIQNIYSLSQLSTNNDISWGIDPINDKIIVKNIVHAIKGFSLKQLVNICNAVPDIGFGSWRWRYNLIYGHLIKRIVEEMYVFIQMWVVIALYMNCDKKNVNYEKINQIPCDTKINAEELFNGIWKSDYNILIKLKSSDFVRTVMYYITNIVFNVPAMSIISQQWPIIYQQLKGSRDIKSFLDIIKNLVEEEIKQRKIRNFQKEQAKLYWWQRKF